MSSAPSCVPLAAQNASPAYTEWTRRRYSSRCLCEDPRSIVASTTTSPWPMRRTACSRLVEPILGATATDLFEDRGAWFNPIDACRTGETRLDSETGGGIVVKQQGVSLRFSVLA